jgi:large subunit ribosomal protein L35
MGGQKLRTGEWLSNPFGRKSATGGLPSIQCIKKSVTLIMAAARHVATGARAEMAANENSPCKAFRGPLFSSTPHMQKTKKSVAKRFKLSAKGKLIRRTPGFRHLLAAKSTKSKRRASRDKLVAEGHAKPLKRALPFGL